MEKSTEYFKMDHPTWGKKYFRVNGTDDVLQIIERTMRSSKEQVSFIEHLSFVNNNFLRRSVNVITEATKEEFYVALDAMIFKFKLNQITMSTIKIEKGIPLPQKATAKKGSKYPFADMKKSDSFALQGKDKKEVNKLRGRLDAASRSFLKSQKKKWKFTSHVDSTHVRIWRTK